MPLANPVHCRPRSRQRGQALTEVVLSALLVLIPTFIFGWTLYAYGQARTSALNGARYAAWERTVWKERSVSGAAAAVRPTNVIEEHMVERFFGKPDAEIRSEYTASNRSANVDLPSFYSLHNGDKVVDIERSPESAEDGEAARPTLTLKDRGDTTSTISSLYGVLDSLMAFLGGGSGPGLENRGLYVATVGARLNAVRHVKVLEDLNLNITQRAAVLTDAWSAGGKEHEEAIVKPMVPMALLADLIAPVRDIFDSLDIGVDRPTPFSEFEPGCIRGDVVPVDYRIGGYKGNNGNLLDSLSGNWFVNWYYNYLLTTEGGLADADNWLYGWYYSRPMSEPERCGNG
jgi:hypothetical protein